MVGVTALELLGGRKWLEQVVTGEQREEFFSFEALSTMRRVGLEVRAWPRGTPSLRFLCDFISFFISVFFSTIIQSLQVIDYL